MAAFPLLKLIFIRHGEDQHNWAKEQLHSDEHSIDLCAVKSCLKIPTETSSLTELGKAQARELRSLMGTLIAKDDRVAFFASDFRRCVQTVVEMNIEGAHWALDRRLREQEDPSTEVALFLAEVLAREDVNFVVMVCHANVIRAAVALLESYTLLDDRDILVVPNCSVRTYTRLPEPGTYLRQVSFREGDGVRMGVLEKVGRHRFRTSELESYLSSL